MGAKLLAEWLRRSGYTDAAFARVLGVSRTTVYRYRTGSLAPNRSNAVKIEIMTAGTVPVGAW